MPKKKSRFQVLKKSNPEDRGLGHLLDIVGGLLWIVEWPDGTRTHESDRTCRIATALDRIVLGVEGPET